MANAPTAHNGVVVRGNDLALWRQLKIILRDMALYALRPGDKLPSERELCARYAVSSITVRQAIASLVSEGILYSEQGRGTFVATRRVVQPTAGTRQTAPAFGQRLISAETVAADDRLSHHLALPQGEEVAKVRLLTLDGDTPVAQEVYYVAARSAPGLLESVREGDLVVADLLRDRYGMLPERVVCSIESVQADEWRASLLGIEAGTQLLLVERTVLLRNGRTAFFARSFYLADRCRLSFELPGSQWPMAAVTP